MMLGFYFFILTTYSFSSVIASDSTHTWTQWKHTWQKKTIHTSAIDFKIHNSSIRDIEVLDVRSDTERLGMYSSNYHIPVEVIADVPLSSLINKKLSNSMAGYTLLYVIRNLWISEVIYYSGKSPVREQNSNISFPKSKLCFTTDVFFKKGEGYLPLIVIDTIFYSKRDVISSGEDFMERALLFIQAKCRAALIDGKYETRRLISKDAIVSGYNKRFDISALNDSTFKKGIFYTWDQFKNNQPVEKGFTFQQNKNEPPMLLIKDENGNDILTRNVFAVSDGDQLFKVQQGFLFPVYRNKNAIYWAGLEKFDLRTKGVPAAFPIGDGWLRAGLEPVASTMKVRLIPYLLNLEKGEEY